MGVYVCLYPDAEGKEEPKIVAVQRGFGHTGVWEEKASRLEIPEGVSSLRFMVWGSRDAVGEFRCDDVALAPAAE